MKKVKLIFGIIIFVSIIFFLVYDSYLTSLNKKKYINKEFKGIIKKIKYFDNRRGLPTIIINDTMCHLGYGAKVETYIKPGDSIIKERGREIIKVYRKDKEGEWHVKKFK